MGKKSRLVVRGATVLLPILLGLSCFSRYNRIADRKENIDSGWARVENAIEERNDLAPMLVSTVKGYAPRETAIYDAISRARLGLAGATNADELVDADKIMREALAGLDSVVEKYPALEADHDFVRLTEEFEDAESRILEARLEYSKSVRRFNTLVSRFPNDMLAGIFNFEQVAEVGGSVEGDLPGADGN